MLSGSEDDFSDLEKQKQKLLKGSAWAVDVTKLPERVPTDDTSGYVESQAELIADAIDESKTEQCVSRPCPISVMRRKLRLFLAFFSPVCLPHLCRSSGSASSSCTGTTSLLGCSDLRTPWATSTSAEPLEMTTGTTPILPRRFRRPFPPRRRLRRSRRFIVSPRRYTAPPPPCRHAGSPALSFPGCPRSAFVFPLFGKNPLDTLRKMSCKTEKTMY